MRKWFEPVAGSRDAADCQVLNRAARLLWPVHREPGHSQLVKLAMTYRRGMSASDLLDAYEAAA